MRHGERADHIDESWKGHPDAVLTETGAKQASETGQMIRQKIGEIEQTESKKMDKITVHVSPFIRTQTTCAQICNELAIGSAQIDYNFCEFLATFLYKENPVHKLFYNSQGISAQEQNTRFNL